MQTLKELLVKLDVNDRDSIIREIEDKLKKSETYAMAQEHHIRLCSLQDSLENLIKNRDKKTLSKVSRTLCKKLIRKIADLKNQVFSAFSCEFIGKKLKLEIKILTASSRSKA